MLNIKTEKLYQNEYAIANWLLTLGYYKSAGYWMKCLEADVASDFARNSSNWDNLAESNEFKQDRINKALRKMCKCLFRLGVVTVFMKKDSHGNYIGQEALWDLLDEYVRDSGIDLDRHFFEEASRHM